MIATRKDWSSQQSLGNAVAAVFPDPVLQLARTASALLDRQNKRHPWDPPVLLESLEEGTADVMTELSLSLLEGAKPPLAWLAGTRKGMPPAPEVRRARYIQTCT